MLSRLDSSYYISEEMFLRERALLFERVWQFFTVQPLVAKHNAFVTRRICGRSIVLQNFDGELRAFDNICLHRQAELQWEPEGVRPLVCRYHAWGYDESGRPDNIPFHDEIYRLPSADLAGRCLKRYAIHVVGRLVFINLAEQPIAFTDQFAPEFIAAMEASSNSYGDDVAVTTFHNRFNWKLAYENLRDGNHPRFVHTKTLAKTFDFQPGIAEDIVAEAKALRASGGLSRPDALAMLRRLSYYGMDSKLADYQPLEWHYGIKRWQEDIGYFNWLAFPNLHIATATGGHAFTIEHHVPISAGVTDMILYWVMAKRDTPYPQAPAVLYANMLGSERVLSEDFEIVSRVQSALHAAAPRTVLGDYEGLNMLVDNWYADLMEGKFVL